MVTTTRRRPLATRPDALAGPRAAPYAGAEHPEPDGRGCFQPTSYILYIIALKYIYIYIYIYIHRANDLPAPWCFLHTTYFTVHKILRAHKRPE